MEGNHYTIFACITILLIGAIFFTQQSERVKNQEIDNAIAKGLSFMNSRYNANTYSFDDRYLQYIYPQENLACPIASCNLTYRILDSYFDVELIAQEVPESSKLNTAIIAERQIINSIIPTWRNSSIYNIKSADETVKNTGIALDTYCIFAYIYNDSIMVKNVFNRLKDNDWMTQENIPSGRQWAAIADESWCLLAAEKTGLYPELTSLLTKDKIKETYEFINSSKTNEDETAALIHTTILLYALQMNPKDNAYFKDLMYQSLPLYSSNHLMQVNIMYALIPQECDLRQEHIIREILNAQESDGRWRPLVRAQDKYADVFTTSRAILTLNAYRRCIQ